MSPFEQRFIGNTEIQLTRLGFGGLSIGNLHKSVSEEDATATVAAAYEKKIRYFDTAPQYGMGKSERTIGAVLPGKPISTVFCWPDAIPCWIRAPWMDCSLCAYREISASSWAAPLTAVFWPQAQKKEAHYNYRQAPPDIIERTRHIEKVCQSHHIPLKAAALQFPLAHPVVATNIPGTSSVARLNENIQLMRHPIPPEFWVALKTNKSLREGAPVPSDNSEPSI